MRTYVLVSFIMSAIAVSIGMLALLVRDFPIERKPYSLQELVFRILLSSGIALWAAYCLWG